MKRSAEDIERIAELEAERDALAAYVEKCQDTFTNLAEYWNGGEGLAAEDAAQHATDVACDMLDETPAIRLARRDAWLAFSIYEALCYGASKNNLRKALSAEKAVEFLLSLARQESVKREPLTLRRQAEEGDT